ncbi:hypothetical protein ES708_11450 [subsurface metagenome]
MDNVTHFYSHRSEQVSKPVRARKDGYQASKATGLIKKRY